MLGTLIPGLARGAMDFAALLLPESWRSVAEAVGDDLCLAACARVLYKVVRPEGAVLRAEMAAGKAMLWRLTQPAGVVGRKELHMFVAGTLHLHRSALFLHRALPDLWSCWAGGVADWRTISQLLRRDWSDAALIFRPSDNRGVEFPSMIQLAECQEAEMAEVAVVDRGRWMPEEGEVPEDGEMAWAVLLRKVPRAYDGVVVTECFLCGSAEEARCIVSLCRMLMAWA